MVINVLYMIVKDVVQVRMCTIIGRCKIDNLTIISLIKSSFLV